MTKCLLFLLCASGGMCLNNCAPLERPPRVQADCSTLEKATEWHRQAILHSLCASLGPVWVKQFSQRGGRMGVYLAVNNYGAFGVVEGYRITLDSAQVAASNFMPEYRMRLEAQGACWPVSSTEPYDTLRVGNQRKLMKRYSVPFYCSEKKPCACP